MGRNPPIATMLLCVLTGWGWALPQGQGFKGKRNLLPSQLQQTRSLHWPLFLSGKVVLDDGTAPSGQVRVELVCNGELVRQVYTASGGAYSLQLGGLDSQLLPIDASVSTQGPLSGGSAPSAGSILGQSLGLAQADWLNSSDCALQAHLSGFLSDRIFLGRRRALDKPDIGIIVLHRTVSAEGAIISLKTLAAPKEAWEAYDKALKKLGEKNIDFFKMSKELEQAVKIYPEFAAAWHLLGEIRLELKDQFRARQAFEQALAADSQYASPYISLAILQLEEERWEEAAQLCRQALELDSQLVRAHYFNALANSFLGNLEVAEESVLRVQRSSQAQDYPATHYILGSIMSQKGNFQSAATEYRRFLEVRPTASIAEKLKQQLTQWKELGLIQSPTDF